MILLDMGGLLPQEEWVLHKAVIAKARRCFQVKSVLTPSTDQPAGIQGPSKSCSKIT